MGADTVIGAARLRTSGSSVHHLDDGLKHARIGLWQYAVTEIEHVPRQARRLGQDPFGGARHDLDRSQADGRIQVALEGDVRPDPSRRHLQRHPPVDADDIRARARHQAEQLAGPHSEMDAGDAQIGEAFEDPPRRWQRELGVLGRRESTDPAVEELYGPGPGLDL